MSVLVLAAGIALSLWWFLVGVVMGVLYIEWHEDEYRRIMDLREATADE